MENLKKANIEYLLENIKRVDKMIELHSTNPSSFMLKQYQCKRDELVGCLIDELVEPDLRSAKGMLMIKTLIERFYPNLSKEANSETNHREDFDELEAILAQVS
jgi:hypothetical protein